MYSKQVLAVALPFVEAFQTDVSEHDMTALKDYRGDIIYAIRRTGTNLILLDGKAMFSLTAKWIEAFTFTGNERFFLGRRGKLREVKRHIALDVWKDYRRTHETTERGPHPLFGVGA